LTHHPNTPILLSSESEFLSNDQLVPLLDNGFDDIAAAGLTITKERFRKLDFTDPYVQGVR
jgi:ABC-type amino acid transport substrate-binding protein